MSGCRGSRNDGLLYIGTIAFLLYLFLIGSSALIRYIHVKPWFHRFREISRIVVIPMQFIGFIGSLIMSIVGITGGGALNRLLVFAGAILALLFFCLGQWARVESIEKQRMWLRMAQLSFTFAILLLYLRLGGEGLAF